MSRKVRGNYKFLSHYTYYVPGVGDIILLLVWLLGGALLGGVVSSVFVLASGLDSSESMQYALLISYPVQFIPAMIYASAKSRNASITDSGIALDSSNFGRTGGVLLALALFFSTILFTFVEEPVNSILPPMPDFLKQLLESMTGGTFWVNFICVAIFAPFFEEWLCRGMVLRGLLGNNVKPAWAIVISALFFAVIHLNPWQAIPAFIIGCLMGYVYYKTGSLRLTMLMHFANNAFALVCAQLPAFSDAESWMDILPKPAFWLVFTCGIIALVLTVKLFSRIPVEKESGNCDTVPSLFTE